MNAGTLNSSSSYTLFNFIETQALLGTGSVPEKACTTVKSEFEEFGNLHAKVHFELSCWDTYCSHCNKCQSSISAVMFFGWRYNYHILHQPVKPPFIFIWVTGMGWISLGDERPLASITAATMCLRFQATQLKMHSTYYYSKPCFLKGP